MLLAGCSPQPNATTDSEPKPATPVEVETPAPDDEEAPGQDDVPDEPTGEQDAGQDEPVADDPPAPQRPATVELPVQVEQVEISLPFVLLNPPSLPFSTYLFADFEQEAMSEPYPGVRAYHPEADMAIEVMLLREDGDAAAAQQAFDALVAASGGYWTETGVPIRPWAAAAAIVHHQEFEDVYYLIPHGDTFVVMRHRYADRYAEAFSPVVQGFVEQWQWDDGTYLEAGSDPQ